MTIELPASLTDHAVQALQELRVQSSRLASSLDADVRPRAERLIRVYPIPVLAVGFGIGYLLGRGIKR
ncbi:MAG TPA: hypothetical protein VLA99_02615 [Nitrospiraceae bacterium]|nr:hypothetical protein [Nitrospiraceae bacterium]